MRLISKTPDFYEYISKIYDPKQDSTLVLNRNDKIICDINENQDLGQTAIDRIRFLKQYDFTIRKGLITQYFELKFFAFAGKLYPVVVQTKDKINDIHYSRKVRFVHDWKLFKMRFKNYQENGMRRWWQDVDKIDSTFFDPIEILNPHKKMCFATTVFEYVCKEFRVIDAEKTNSHLLVNYGFQNQMSAEQAYQMISMYVADVKNVEKNYKASNSEKINSHGYDKNYSFRSNHPMKT